MERMLAPPPRTTPVVMTGADKVAQVYPLAPGTYQILQAYIIWSHLNRYIKELKYKKKEKKKKTKASENVFRL